MRVLVRMIDLWNSPSQPRDGGSWAGRTVGAGSATWFIACGLFIFILAVYVLSSPGRIDIVDGQMRFDVSYHLLITGRPSVGDGWLGPLFGVVGRKGYYYSFYGPAGSVIAMPLVWAGIHLDPRSIQASEFLFSLASAILGAAIAPLLFVFYLELGAAPRRALLWTLISSFATYLWPIATSSFDNAQHGFFALSAVYLGLLSARRNSARLALLGGLSGAVLLLYQEYFVLLVPAFGLATIEWPETPCASARKAMAKEISWMTRLEEAVSEGFQQAWAMIRRGWDHPGKERSSCVRYALFMLGASSGVMLALAFNYIRFGSVLSNGRANQPYPLFGNPMAGFLTLIVSPGKGVFFYSPVLILGILGIRRLWQRMPSIGAVIIASSAILLSFISCIAFAAGDWCWGPRYLTSLMPLWALSFPDVPEFKLKSKLVPALIALGLGIQCMALSVEHQRFFFQQGLNDFFWAENPWFYLTHSALLARVGEVIDLREGVPPTATRFNSLPIPEWTTHCLLGPPPNVPRSLAGIWIRYYQIYFLPRPWPIWMRSIPASERAVNVYAWTGWLIIMGALGGILIILGLHGIRRQPFPLGSGQFFSRENCLERL